MKEETFEEMVQILLGEGHGHIDCLFTPTEIADLRTVITALYLEDELRLPGIGNKAQLTVKKKVRNDRIHWLDESSIIPVEQLFFERLNGFVNYLNRTCFAGITSTEFHYAAYKPGSFYKRHADQFNNDDGRVISFVMYLHESWMDGDGGELMIYQDKLELKVQPMPGRVVIFNSEIEHEVLPANQLRLSLTGWLKRKSTVI